MIHRTLYILFIFFPVWLAAQDEQSEYVKEINRQAIILTRDGKFDEAEKTLNNLLIELEANSADLKFQALTWQTLAKVLLNQGNYDESFSLARRSLEYSLSAKDSLNVADNLNTIGINHYHMSQYDSTAYYYEKSLELKRKLSTDPYSLAVSEYNLGIVYEDFGNPEKALEFYHRAEENLILSSTKKNFLSDIYVGISHIYFYGGDSEKAMIYVEKALNQGLETYGPDNPNITFVYTSYANILEYKGRYKDAIELLEKSLEIRKKSYGENHRWTCETYYDLASTYVLDNQYEKAEKLFKHSIKIGENTDSKQYLSYARTYLAGLYLDQEKNLDQAEKLLYTSLKEKERIFGLKNEVVAENYTRLARLAMIRNDEGSFFTNIEKSLFATNYNKDSIQKVIAPLHALEALMLTGEWYETKYHETGERENLLRSFDLLEEEVDLVWHIQRNFSTDRSKINLANEYREVFEAGMNLCWQLFHQTKNILYMETAFDLSEANRNTTLLDGLQDIKYKLYADLPDELLSFENALKSELERVKMDLYYEKAASEPDKEFLTELMDSRIRLTFSLDSIHEVFRRDYPRYRDLKYENNDIDLEDIQSNLDENSQLLTYFLGEQNLFSFTITQDTVKFLKSDIAQKVIDKTNQFKKNLVDREEVLNIAQELYLYLMYQQIEPSKKKMIVVPDNVLNYIPFEILTDQYEAHLINDYRIGYAGGTRIYLELMNDFFSYEIDKNWVGFAPEYDEEFRLSSNRVEVSSISNLTEGDSFLGEKATKENFLNNNKNYSILHLAMHAEIDNNNPLYNKLKFSDGELTASEIYISESRANLAILSACNTGFGKFEKGEGVMSMARAFHFSGIPAVVMSLWKVPDRETKTIMLAFYKHLKSGDSKSQALRKAKLDYIKNTEDRNLRHPYYWAGFVVNGNTEALKIDNGDRYKWYGLTAGLILLATVLFISRKKGVKN